MYRNGSRSSRDFRSANIRTASALVSSRVEDLRRRVIVDVESFLLPRSAMELSQLRTRFKFQGIFFRIVASYVLTRAGPPPRLNSLNLLGNLLTVTDPQLVLPFQPSTPSFGAALCSEGSPFFCSNRCVSSLLFLRETCELTLCPIALWLIFYVFLPRRSI